LLHLVGYLYYWQMGFNSVFKGLNIHAFLSASRGNISYVSNITRVFRAAYPV